MTTNRSEVVVVVVGENFEGSTPPNVDRLSQLMPANMTTRSLTTSTSASSTPLSVLAAVELAPAGLP
jgi:hypothetical protein